MHRGSFVETLWRYVWAIVVTFAVAAVVVGFGVKAAGIGVIEFLSGANLIGVTVQRPIESVSIAIVAAFLGVLAGSLCILRQSRIAACLILTAILVMVYQTLWFIDWQYEVTSKHGNSSLVLPLVAGGCSALAMMILSAQRNSKSPRAA